MQHGERFDYIAYDETRKAEQKMFKERFTDLAMVIEQHLDAGRAKSIVFTKLEEAYMWVGKALRDTQIAESGDGPHKP